MSNLSPPRAPTPEYVLHPQGSIYGIRLQDAIRKLWDDPDPIEMVPPMALRFTRAMLITDNGRPKIIIRDDPGLTAYEARFSVAHELAHWAFRRAGTREVPNTDQEEEEADLLGAAILSSPSTFRRILRRFGRNREKVLDALQIPAEVRRAPPRVWKVK